MSAEVFAAVGDVHDHFRDMVSLVEEAARAQRVQPSFVLQVGDFQPNRHEEDLRTMAAPSKYKTLGDFGEFWTGRRKFPWPVYFIAGNHEPFGWLEQHRNGARLMDNCSYLGRVGKIDSGGLSVVGLSGIHLDGREDAPHPGPEEFGRKSNKDYIHFTDDEVMRAASLGPADILLVHDWPAGLIRPEDAAGFERGYRAGKPTEIGNARARMLVELLAPRLVLCGHMHRAYSGEILLPGGGHAAVHCLNEVKQGRDAVALFRIPTLERIS